MPDNELVFAQFSEVSVLAGKFHISSLYCYHYRAYRFRAQAVWWIIVCADDIFRLDRY